ncbi:MAG TPA: hypothetical protein VGY55_10340 [Pirellulales bacterium]|nr:hypothetical protein [Pirellulales bacterium]
MSQASAVHRAGEVLRSGRLLLQTAAGDAAALPNAVLHVRPATGLRLPARTLRQRIGTLI